MYTNLHEDYNLFSQVLAFIAIKYMIFRNIGAIDKETN